LQLAGRIEEGGKNVVVIDCSLSSSSVNAEIETLVVKQQGGSIKTDIRKALTDFANSQRQSVIVDPTLTNQERKLVHDEARKLGLKTKSDGPDKARVLTCWKQGNYRPPIANNNNNKTSNNNINNNNKSPSKYRGGESVVTSGQKEAVFEAVVGDSSNSCLPVVVIAEAPLKSVESWICSVCEADNSLAETICSICLMEREE
jgi:hypothetical protein